MQNFPLLDVTCLIIHWQRLCHSFPLVAELDDKTKEMLNLIEQDADSFAQRAEMYYKKRPVLVDMLGDLYRTHRALAEQCDLLKQGSGARHTVFGLSSRTKSRPQTPMNTDSSCSVSAYDSESEVDDPEQEESELSEVGTELSQEQKLREQVEQMRAETERLKEQNVKVAGENAALKAELAGKDEEKREVIRQLAVSLDMVREENCTLRDRIRESKTCPSRAFDLKKVAKNLFSARLFTAHCRPTGPIVAL
jgi:hypothetical protein